MVSCFRSIPVAADTVRSSPQADVAYIGPRVTTSSSLYSFRARVMVQLRLLDTRHCIHARRDTDTAHASPRTSKMRASCAQSVPAAGVRSSSSARYGWSRQYFYQLADAGHRVGRLGNSPKSRCTEHHGDRLEGYGSTGAGRWPHCGHQWHRPRPDGYGDTMLARPNAYFSWRARMTTVHLTPRPLVHPSQREPVSALMVGGVGLFLSHVLTVVRETPKIRTKPRSEVRS